MCCLLTMNGTNHCLSGLLSGTGKCGCGRNPDVSEGPLRGAPEALSLLWKAFRRCLHLSLSERGCPLPEGFMVWHNKFLRNMTFSYLAKGFA